MILIKQDNEWWRLPRVLSVSHLEVYDPMMSAKKKTRVVEYKVKVVWPSWLVISLLNKLFLRTTSAHK